MRLATTIAAAVLLAACGGQPEYCDDRTDTRHVGTWNVEFTETSGDCGALDSRTIEYPDPVPVPNAELELDFSRVRHKAWLQADCAYEGSFHYEVEPTPQHVIDGGGDWPSRSTQVARVTSVGDGEITGTLTLSFDGNYKGDHQCESTYDVSLVRLD